MNDESLFLAKIAPSFDGTKFVVPPPRLSFHDRLRRRLAWRNERKLYRRECDSCKSAILAIYPGDAPFPVYCGSCWWKDGWSPFDYGRPFVPGRPFFEQLCALQSVVPRVALIQLSDTVNSDYTHDVQRLQDCYLVFDGEEGRHCLYGETFFRTSDCLDFLDLVSSELCYECVACEECYRLRHSLNCFKCSESWFLRDCRGCRRCFACANLDRKENYIRNQPVSAGEFDAFIDSLTSGERGAAEDEWEKALRFWASQPVRFMRGVNNENVTGDHVSFSKDSHWCFNCREVRDCAYCTNLILGANDCRDVDVWGNGIELCYEGVCLGERVRETIGCLYVSHGAERVYYSQFCSRGVSNLFGCIGLRHAHHCALNVSLSSHEFEKLAARIAAQMKEEGTWGEYPSEHHSPFAYEDTVADEFFPASAAVKDETPAQGGATGPDAAVKCAVSGRFFRLQPAESAFYTRMALPPPVLHPDVRHRRRLALRNARNLWNRNCAKCGADLMSACSPGRPEPVLCERCYSEIRE
jgi:hypothetical protein